MQVVRILRKELQDYFVSPIAYIVIAIFLLVTGWFFFSTFFLLGQASLRNFFSLLPIVFSFIVPAVTMRLFAEEMKVGSYEIIFTMPVTFRDIILGKFFAGLTLIAAMLIPTFAYPLSISFIGGTLDWGPVAGGYIGALFLGAAFAAIGIWASSVTRNQIVAFIVGTVICFALALVDKMLIFFPRGIVDFIVFFGADYHFQNIAKGVVDSRDVLYFLSVVIIGLYATYMTLHSRN